MEPKLVTIHQIAEARERLRSAVVHTPMLLSEELWRRIDRRIYYKCENLQVFWSQLQVRKPLPVR